MTGVWVVLWVAGAVLSAHAGYRMFPSGPCADLAESFGAMVAWAVGWPLIFAPMTFAWCMPGRK